MKKFFVSSLALNMLMLGVCVVGQAQARADFSGTWALDLKKTGDVPPTLKSYTLTVRQDEQQITIDSKVEGDPNPALSGTGQDTHAVTATPHPTTSVAGIASPGTEGSVGASSNGPVIARGRALALIIRHMTCSLDGKEATRELGGLTPGQIRRKAQWKKGDKSVEIYLTRDFDFQGRQVSSTVKEQWELSEDKKVLKIKRTVNLLAGFDEVTLIFNRQ